MVTVIYWLVFIADVLIGLTFLWSAMVQIYEHRIDKIMSTVVAGAFLFSAAFLIGGRQWFM